MKFKILLFFIIPLNLISQITEKNYEVKTDLYLPTYKMIKVLYEFDKCNQENKVDGSNIYYSINLGEKKNSQVLYIASGEKVIPDVSVEWDNLNISGAILFKNRLVVLDMSSEQIEELGFLFNKTDKIIERSILLDQYGSSKCFSNYSIKNQKLKLDYHSDNY